MEAPLHPAGDGPLPAGRPLRAVRRRPIVRRGEVHPSGRRGERDQGPLRGHRKGEFAAAYSYFGPTYRSVKGREAWISEEQTYGITGSTINFLDVTYADGTTAAATVDVTFRDGTGAPRFLISWLLVRENGAWKLDQQTSVERL